MYCTLSCGLSKLIEACWAAAREGRLRWAPPARSYCLTWWGLEQQKEDYYMFLAPMSETHLSVGGGKLTWLTSFSHSPCCDEPGGARCIVVAF